MFENLSDTLQRFFKQQRTQVSVAKQLLSDLV
jgi:hypothetical protein